MSSSSSSSNTFSLDKVGDKYFGFAFFFCHLSRATVSWPAVRLWGYACPLFFTYIFIFIKISLFVIKCLLSQFLARPWTHLGQRLQARTRNLLANLFGLRSSLWLVTNALVACYLCTVCTGSYFLPKSKQSSPMFVNFLSVDRMFLISYCL